IRFDMQIVDVSDIAKECGFKVFNNAVTKGGAVRAINIPGGNSFTRNEIDELTEWAITYGAQGMAWIGIEDDGSLRTLLTKFLSESDTNAIIEKVEGKPGDLIIFCADELPVVYKTLGNLRLDIGDKLGLRDKGEFKFLIVTEFPLLEWSEEEERYVAVHHPFTMPVEVDQFLLAEDLANINAMSYDFVLNGVELGSGSIRIHRQDVQNKMFKVLGLSSEEIEERFGFILEAFSYGTPPHGGFAFGLDRLVMIMAGSNTIRDVIAFPKAQDASSLMTEAPSPVHKEQLDQLGLSLGKDGASESIISEDIKKDIPKFNIDELAELSQFDISGEEKEELEKDIEKIINSVSILQDID